MELKTCLHCKIEKDIEDFPKYKNRDGTYSYRNVCKVCRNAQRHKSDEIYTSKIVNKEQSKYKIEERRYKDIFNEDEINTLKKLIKDYEQIKEMLNNKITLEKDYNEKTKKTISILTSVHDKINDISRKTNLNYSEVINNLLKKALETYID